MAWEVVVGLESHTQLLTKSKMFSGAPNAFGAAPNTQASAVDIALPGTLPVANRAAVEHAISSHGHTDSEELRSGIESALKPEQTAAAS